MNKILAYKQVYQRIHQAILQGILKPGDKIPSARALAKEMGVARGTVEEGYALLKAEGYIQSKGQAGTIVNEDLHQPFEISKAQVNTRQPGLNTQIETPKVLPFQLGIPALDAFPRQMWSRMTTRCARNTHVNDLAYPSIYGNPALRIAIAQYLQLSRGVQCEPRQIFITSGYVHSINWMMHVLFKSQSNQSTQATIAMEDPGYPLTRKVLENNQLNILPLPVDQEGVKLSPKTKADAIIVTPAHQSPTCVSLSLQRRQVILDWANKNQSWIIEDDYDGEYRHTGSPLPALKSLDTQERVIYSGTFSKVLFPSLRMAYIVVPKHKVNDFEQYSELYAGNISELIQRTVCAFMQEGHLSRHIQRMRKLYRERLELTARIFNQVLGEHVIIKPQPGGMHMIVKLKNKKIDDQAFANKMIASGLFAQGLSQWSSKPVHPSLILSFTNIKTEENCLELAYRLKTLFEG